MWQLLPQWLKNIPRAVRSQWHGDFYDEIKRRDDVLLRQINKQAATLKELGEKVTSLQQLPAPLKQLSGHSAAQMKIMAEWQQANLCNQLSLANKRPGGRTVFMPWFPVLYPWSTRDSFHVTMQDNGHLCFYPTENIADNHAGIIVHTLPKSGTHFIGAILESFGYMQAKVFGAGNCYVDINGMTNKARQDNPDIYVYIPFDVQIGMIPPSQFYLSHIETPEILARVRQYGMKMLTSVRDLRYALVSFMRYEFKNTPDFQPLSEYTSADILRFLKTRSAEVFFQDALGCADLQGSKNLYQVRYEELVSCNKDKMLPSLKAISEVIGRSVDDVFKAAQDKYGVKTHTFTNDPVTGLDRIWTKEVEELFIAKGGDVLNEKLGYSRQYIPKN